MIDRAAARFLVEKHASLLKDHILRAAQHALATRPVNLRVTLLCDRASHSEIFSQPIDIALRDLHALVNRTTISRAL